MVLLATCVQRSAALLCIALVATNVVSTNCRQLQDKSMDGEEEDLFEQALIDSERAAVVDEKPKKAEREPCDGVFISEKGNRFTDCGPWRLKKRAGPPPKGPEAPGGWGLVEEAAVPTKKHDPDFLGWIWVFGAWEDGLFKMVSVDRQGKKIECRYSKREDINTTFMPDQLTADELQPFWDIAVKKGESPEERPTYHPPPGSYNVEVDIFCKKDTHNCDETLYGRGGVGYRGCQSFTRHGEPCQKWTDQSPITHNNTPEKRPGKGLGDHNFCRNPDGMQTIWCYIAKENMNADRRRACKKNPTPHRGALWEWCLPMNVYVDPNLATTTTTTVCQPLGDFKVRLLNKDMACHSRDRHYMGKFTRQRCAEVVRANGYRFFNWVKWCATGGCGAVGTKSAECREGFRKSTKFDFFEIEDTGSKQTYVKHHLVKAGHTCKSGELFLGWMSSLPGCANAVKGEGGKFFSYGNRRSPHTAGACYKEDTKSSTCPEGWDSSGNNTNFDFYAIDKSAQDPTHSGAECFHSQCCQSEGSAPCTWCGGEDWYCCDAKKKYPSGDKCANAEFNSTSQGKRYDKYSDEIRHRCARLKSSSKPSPPAPQPSSRRRSKPRPPASQPSSRRRSKPRSPAPEPEPTTTPPSTTVTTSAPTKPQRRRASRSRRRSRKGPARRRRRGSKKGSRRRRGSKKGPARRRSSKNGPARRRRRGSKKVPSSGK